MSQLFDKIKVGSPSRSTFDLSHHQVTTSDFGYLLPICVREMVPNDDFVVTPHVFTRLAPLAVPCYGRITCRIHHFFVPNRILYKPWSYFITGNKNNTTEPPYFTVGMLRTQLQKDPQINPTTTSGFKRGKYARLMSNFGLSPDILTDYGQTPHKFLSDSERINALPFLAYYRLWMDYFMDSNIYDHSMMELIFNQMIEFGGNLDDYFSFLETKSVCYKKDYFTTAKLNPQAGSDPSSVELGINPDLIPARQNNLEVGDDGTVHVDDKASKVLSQFTIEALRAANSLQNWLERSNFVGTKIINQILAHFGVAPTPERLDMAEFIGGSSFPIQIGDVTSTSGTPTSSTLDSTGLGMQAGKGVGAGSGEQIRYHAKEHGIFMSVMSILPDTGYYQGLSKMWSRGVNGDYLDYYTPEFENLGYQEILNKEVFVPSGAAANYPNYDGDGVFGYTPRFSEYKFQNDVLGSDFVGLGLNTSQTIGAPLDSWHLFRKLNYSQTNPLALNENFVECNNLNNDYDRIFQVTNNQYDHFYFNIDVDVKATRPMTGITAPSLDVNMSEDGNSIELPYGGTRL